ncbi:hypothetical protein DXG01_004809, partial [Tephrocybe rancida]
MLSDDSKGPTVASIYNPATRQFEAVAPGTVLRIRQVETTTVTKSYGDISCSQSTQHVIEETYVPARSATPTQAPAASPCKAARPTASPRKSKPSNHQLSSHASRSTDTPSRLNVSSEQAPSQADKTSGGSTDTTAIDTPVVALSEPRAPTPPPTAQSPNDALPATLAAPPPNGPPAPHTLICPSQRVQVFYVVLRGAQCGIFMD